MSDQSVSALSTRSGSADNIKIISDDRRILHSLAKTVAELAQQPIEEAKRELWYRHNALEETRPLVFCDPENGWNEIITPNDLACSGDLARDWEMALRKEIFWGSQMRDDRVILPEFHLPHVYTETDWGMHEQIIGGEHGGAYTWDAPLKDYALIDRMRFPVITVNWEATRLREQLAQEVIGDVLPVRLKSTWWWTLGMTQTLAYLRGITQFLMDFIDQPDGLHRVMAFLRDGTLARLDFLEHNDLLSLNTGGSYVGSGGFGWTRDLPQTDFTGKVRTRDMWGFAESQETSTISPRMFAEFILPYQMPILERFGLNCYGCCEPLDNRWKYVEKIPRLRRVSVSPWSNLAVMAERLGPNYILSLKPNPADLAADTLDEERIRAGLREAVAICKARNCRPEIIMKDNHTIANDPRRVIRWVEIAKEESGA